MVDFTFITPRLATGGGLSGPADAEQLIAAGITHVVDCTDAEDDTPFFPASPIVRVLYNGIPDDGNPATHGDTWFGKSLSFALPALSVPHTRVYAHCSAGCNRGPSTALAIMLALGWDATVAEQLMRAKRPVVTLAYKDEAIASVASLGYC